MLCSLAARLSAILLVPGFHAAAAEPLTSVERAIPFDQLGTEADKSGAASNTRSITPTKDGATLDAMMQDLQAEATQEGLWLTSVADEDVAAPNRFRVRAVAVGRDEAAARPFLRLPSTGRVQATEAMASWVRPGLIEEYTVSTDGVRQDFVVLERPQGFVGGKGRMVVELEVTDARAEAASYGAKLIEGETGRELAYSRLKVTDAGGRELAAHMEVPAPNRLRLVVADEGATYPVRIDPTFSDADWLSMGGIPGANNLLLSMVVDPSGNLFVGGSFTEIGEVQASRIAKWDGSDWSALGSGANNPVDSLAVDGGMLYAGGGFTTMGGVTVNRVARWDGTTWTALGSGTDGQVLALVASGGNLYAGGVFTTAGGVTVNSIAKWDGSAWSALGSGMSDGGFPIVYSLALWEGELYAGGIFSAAGGVSASRIAKWNGSGWSALGSGASGTVRALAADETNLYVGGDFTMAGGINANRIARWDGDAWAALGSGMNNSVNALAVGGGGVYAGGSFTTAGGVTVSRVSRWDGGSWNALAFGVSSTVRALAVDGGNLYAGGSFTAVGDVLANFVAKWDSSEWSALGRALDGQVSALAVSGGNIYAAGAFTMAGGVTANRVAKWDGNLWTPLGSGIDGPVFALAVNGTSLYAGGEFTVAGGVTANRVAQWNGAAWSALGTGVGATVNALAVNGNDLYVGGNFGSAGGISANYIAKWNGAEWSALGSGMAGGFSFTTVNALAVDGGTVFAGGRFTSAGGVSANYVAKWNGSVWSALGDGMNDEVHALALNGTELYAGGQFTMADGMSASRIARWNGSAWNPLGSGVGGGSGFPIVSALAVGGRALYVGGTFTTAGGVPANYVAKWGGQGWSALGSGTNSAVAALATDETNVYAGGLFTQAGGKFRFFVARGYVGVGAPEIAVSGNGLDITDGDLTPETVDGTDFGTVPITDGIIERTFTITNDGSADLTFTGVAPNYITLTGSPAFSVIAQPTVAFVAAEGGTQTFTIRYDPETQGPASAIVSIANDAAAEGAFTFAVSGTGENLITSTFSNTATVSIPTGAPDTSAGPASPYPSAIAVSDVTGTILKVVVKLKGFTHTYPSDVDILLVGPDGTTCLLMSGVGNGSSVSDLDLVIDSDAADFLPPSNELTSGTYRPTNEGAGDPFDAPAPVGPYGTSLAVYDSLPKVIGTWSLFVMDGAEGDYGALERGWEVCITTAPPAAPEIAVSGNSVDIASGDSTPDSADHTDFGTAAIEGSMVPRTFTITNTGANVLNLTGTPKVIISGTHAADFTVTLDADTPVAAGGGTTAFKVAFDPTAVGLRTATVSIPNDDTDEDPFTFAIQGTGETAQVIFEAATTGASLVGPNATANAAPFQDGVANLLKYAFNMNLTGPDVSQQVPGAPPGGLPAIGFDPGSGGGPVFRIEFVRRIRSGLVYAPQKSTDLTPLSWMPLVDTPTVIPIDSDWERVIYEEPINPTVTPHYFGRVEVTLP